MPAAIFDLDGTLIPPPSAEWRLLRMLGHSGALKQRAFANCLLRSALESIRGREPRFCRDYLEIVAPAQLAGMIAAVARDIVGHIPAAALEVIGLHRSAGHQLALLTGTPQVLADQIAAALRFDCARGDCAARPTSSAEPAMDLGSARAPKVGVFARWCRERAWDPRECYAYANTIADVGVLAAVGHPTVVDPDWGLLRHAEQRGWPILWWHGQDGEWALWRRTWQLRSLS
jgi:phosphoserine phosphatase